MRESAFIRQNRPRWEEFEKIINSESRPKPDRLAELYIQVTDDLSFSRTQYPESRTTTYLNGLATKVHLAIYRNKQERASRFRSFWEFEVPLIALEAQRPIIYAGIIFIIPLFLGILSTLNDDTYARLVMGDDYVNMTLENIQSGNPTRVYSDSPETGMFFAIAWNNIMVALRILAMGALLTFLGGLAVAYNGLVIGAFLGIFIRESKFLEAFPVVMLHGTIELSILVVTGGAALMAGNGFLYPGTYPRLTSFMIQTRKALKLLIGVLPFIVVAAFIESFITRYHNMPVVFKAVIIAGSAALIVGYFIVYPRTLRHE